MHHEDDSDGKYFVSVTVVIFMKICTFNLPKEPKFQEGLDVVELFECERVP